MLFGVGSLLDSIDDLHVAGASAEIPCDRLFDIVARRIRINVEQRSRGDQHSGRADSALRAAAFQKSLLKRIEPPISREAFDGENSRAIDLTNRNEAGVDHFAVDYHRARAALAFTAALFCPGQAQVFTKHVQQALHWRYIDLSVDRIDFESESHNKTTDEYR